MIRTATAGIPLTVLIVEDVERDAELVVLALEQGGYDPQYLRVETPEEMSAALQERSWQIVIADYHLPLFSGLAALELLRKSGLDIPLILVSGAVGEELAVEAMKAGASDYLMKQSLKRLAPAVQRELREAEDRKSRRDAEAALSHSEQRLHAIFDQAPVGIAQLDGDGHWQLLNPRLHELLGYTLEELSVLRFNDVTTSDGVEADRAQFAQLLAGSIPSYSMQRRIISKDGSEFWAQVNTSLVREHNGEMAYTLLTVEDISERKGTEEALLHQTLHDKLTSLPNRVLLHDRLEQGIRDAQRENTSLSLLILDLDRFKDINDTFGHHCGDILLQDFGARLNRVLRDSDTVGRLGGRPAPQALARLGGDEFGVLLPRASPLDASAVAERIASHLIEPFTVEDQALDIGASVGIAVFPDHGESAELLFQHADVAMYTAKRNKAGHAFYDPAEDPYTRGRIALMADLRHAIENNELSLHYQPKVDIASGTVLGAEALIRWEHHVEGAVPAPQIIDLAEHTGLIKPLTVWVLNTAIAECRGWQNVGHRLSVAVNLSARSLHDYDLFSVIRDLLRTWDLPSTSLVLEVTETAVMISPERASAIIGQLHASGVRISIDDFGTGYSSLAYLQGFPADEVKIDRSFVEHMHGKEDDMSIVRAAIALAHDLGMTAVAEGVETKETCDQLAQLRCDAGQGYYFGRPMQSSAFAVWLAEEPARRPVLMKAG